MEFCRHTFGLSEDPFGADLPRKDIMVTPVITATKERIDYAVRMGGIALMTGDIGSGKSTTLRYLIGDLHPSDYQVISVTACSGSILELYRQILGELGRGAL
jgi:type II secretory pathway predicted ATPase ExeA